MSRKLTASNPACPHCGHAHTVRNGHVQGRQGLRCKGCQRFFGVTNGTPLYRLHHPADAGARSLLVVMRRGSLSAAAEKTGHKYETLGRWLRAAAAHADAVTEALVQELDLTAVAVDAFWSFVKKSMMRRKTPTLRRAGEGKAGVA